MASSMNIYPVSDGSRITSAPAPTMSTIPGFAEMEVDGAFYNMMENMDVLAGGGLTGLEDWSMDTNDFYHSMGMSNWPPSAGTGG
jgi:hypothetical protein